MAPSHQRCPVRGGFVVGAELVDVVWIGRGRGGHDGSPKLSHDEGADTEEDGFESDPSGVLLVGSHDGEARDVKQPERLMREQVLEAIDGVTDQGVLLQ